MILLSLERIVGSARSIWVSIKVKWELTADAEEIATLKSLLGSSATLPNQADELEKFWG